MWAEVKGVEPTHEELTKAVHLCGSTHKDVLILVGAPKKIREERDQIGLIFVNERDQIDLYGDNLGANVIKLHFCLLSDGTLALGCSYLHHSGYGWPDIRRSLDELDNAYERAAYARFEHGEE
jgi:hypothetical protein